MLPAPRSELPAFSDVTLLTIQRGLARFIGIGGKPKILDNLRMAADQIIEEIKRLDAKEQLRVILFVYQLDAERQLSGAELSGLAKRMVDASDEVEAARIRETIVRGFYGQQKNA